MPDLAPPEDEEMLLDLLNTTPVVDGTAQDLLGGDGAVAWLRARGGSGSAAEAAHARRVRDRLQAVVRGEVPGTALEPVLAGVHLRPVIDGAVLGWRLDVEDAGRFAARALVAWGQVQERLPGRLRACANEECSLFLVDRSKPNTARWCSMKGCGNRLKARRHYERSRRGTGA